ncbi:PHP domain-containing protein [Chloroflexota bacterium]
MPKADLHVHSSVSDGCHSPEEIVRMAAGLGIETLAIADHDNIGGIARAIAAARQFPNLRLIPNVEISTYLTEGEAHILGYFINYQDEKLQKKLTQFGNSRVTRAEGMVAKLATMGVNLPFPRVLEIAGEGSVGRPHIAAAMMEKGYITHMAEAFDRYIGNGGPAYVERDKLTPAAAVELICEAGGLPGLAHPTTVRNIEGLVRELKMAGLVAIEAYYKDYSTPQVQELLNIANHYKLIPTGGTDYHGNDPNEIMMGDVYIPPQSISQLFALAEARGLALD